MTALGEHVADYLALRRSLGFKLVHEGYILPQFAAYLESAGSSRITADLAITWARLPAGVQPVTWTHRLGAVRGFARYLHAIDPATEIPPRAVFAGQGKRPTPYVYSDTDIDRLLTAAGDLRPALRAATYRNLFGLLAVSGMRIREALNLRRTDLDLRAGVVTVIGGKSGATTRLLPLHPSTIAALRGYQRLRDRSCPAATADGLHLHLRNRVDLRPGAGHVQPTHHHHRAPHRHRAPADVESVRGAVPVLPRARFPGPLAAPGVRVSTHRALHGSCRQAGLGIGQGVGILLPR
jgi:integrase